MSQNLRDVLATFSPTTSPVSVGQILGIHTLQMVQQSKTKSQHADWFFQLDDITYVFETFNISKEVIINKTGASRQSAFPAGLYQYNKDMIIPSELLLESPIVCNIGIRCLEEFCESNHQDAYYFINEETGQVILEFGYMAQTDTASFGVAMVPFIYYDLKGYTPKFLVPESEEDRIRRLNKYNSEISLSVI
jgi:hypothetical protein